MLACCAQLAVLDQDDVSSGDAAKFYALLGSDDPSAAAAAITPTAGVPEAAGEAWW